MLKNAAMSESSEIKDDVTSSHEDKDSGSCSPTEPQIFPESQRCVLFFFFWLIWLFYIKVFWLKRASLLSSCYWPDSLNGVFLVLRFISRRELPLQCLAVFLWRVMHQWILQLNSRRKINGKEHLLCKTSPCLADLTDGFLIISQHSKYLFSSLLC